MFQNHNLQLQKSLVYISLIIVLQVAMTINDGIWWYPIIKNDGNDVRRSLIVIRVKLMIIYVVNMCVYGTRSLAYICRVVNELIRSIVAWCSVRKKLGSIHKRVNFEHNFKFRFIDELNLSTVEFDSIVREQVRIMSS